MITTACPLDCYDACEVQFEDNLKASKTHILSNGKLCSNFGRLVSNKPINLDRNIDDLLEILKTKLQSIDPQRILFYKGSGNMGVMNDITKLIFSQIGATIASGSLCDGAGEVGIVQDRQNCLNPPFENLLNSEVVVVWGRNLTVTSPHIYAKIKDKTFITIDPIKTDIAKRSALHIQIKPKTDYLLALLLSRFVFMENSEDKDFLDSIDNNYKDFYDLTRSIKIKEALDILGLSLDNLGDFLHLIQDKKVAFLVGIGVQKYFEGDEIVRCIDGLGAILGLFNKPFGGVWYLSDSKNGFENPFATKPTKNISKANPDFGAYDLVFIQGANPVVSSPNSQKIIEGLQKAYVVYFGTTLNETCKYADLIIPAKSFMAKNDIRLSYATDEIVKMNKIIDEPNCISEYELAKFLMPDIEDEAFYLGHFKQRVQNKSITKFDFIETIEVQLPRVFENEFYFVTCKSKDSLNSQFAKSNLAYFHPSSALTQGQIIKLSSKVGSAEFEVCLNEDIRSDTVMIYAGTKGVNYLSSSMTSQNGESAIYQELKVVKSSPTNKTLKRT